MFTTGVLENETWYLIQTNNIRYKSKRTLDEFCRKKTIHVKEFGICEMYYVQT